MKTLGRAGLLMTWVVLVACAGRPKVPPCHVAILQELHARAKHMTAQQVEQVAATLCEEVRRAQLEPLVVLALVDLESGFDATVVSSRGATGLMQLMPPTTAAVAKRHHLVSPGTGDLDPAFNVTLGIRYLADLRSEFVSIDRALLAYNLGPPAMHALLQTHGKAFDATTQPFVMQVTQRLESLRHRYAPPAS